MPEFESEPTVDAIHRADRFLDAIAGGQPVHPHDAADAELAVLLGTWRDEMRWPPATDLISEADAVAALNAGRAEKRLGYGRERWNVDTEITPRKNRRSLSVVGAAAAAVLCIGGFGAVVAGSGPGDSLYGLRTMLFGTPKEVRDDQVGLAAKTTLNQVQDLITQGDWTTAQDKLVEVSSQVASIGDEQQKQVLLDQFNDLSAKVVERDPAATAPPGVVYTVPPSAAQLVPAVAPTTSSTAAPSTADSATPTTSATVSPTTAATSGAPETSGTPAPETAASSSAAPGTESATSAPTESPAPSSASPTAQSQPTTTPTSAAPTATESASAPSSATPAPTTAVPSTSAAPAATAGSTAPASTAVSAPTTAAQSAVENAPAPQSAVTTTVPVPVPAG